MSSKIVGWLVGVWDGKILGLKKKIWNPEKNSRLNQEMVNTIFLPFIFTSASCSSRPSCFSIWRSGLMMCSASRLQAPPLPGNLGLQSAHIGRDGPGLFLQPLDHLLGIPLPGHLFVKSRAESGQKNTSGRFSKWQSPELPPNINIFDNNFRNDLELDKYLCGGVAHIISNFWYVSHTT